MRQRASSSDTRSSLVSKLNTKRVHLINALRSSVASIDLGKSMTPLVAGAISSMASERNLSSTPQATSNELIIEGFVLTRPTSKEQISEWFGPAIVEIQRLLTSDSWPRFQLSPEYQNVMIVMMRNVRKV